MITRSPLIANGELALNSSGDLVFAPDIQTQMAVSLTAYNCIYDYSINSLLITYLFSIPPGGIQQNTIKNIIVSAYQILITANIITDLAIAIIPVTQDYITIKIRSVDTNGQNVSLTWDNAQ